MMRVLPLFILLMFGGCYDSLTKADLCNPRFEDCSQYESNSGGTSTVVGVEPEEEATNNLAPCGQTHCSVGKECESHGQCYSGMCMTLTGAGAPDFSFCTETCLSSSGCLSSTTCMQLQSGEMYCVPDPNSTPADPSSTPDDPSSTPDEHMQEWWEEEEPSTEPTESEDTFSKCSDGFDNDGNGYVDCEDFSCSKSEDEELQEYCVAVNGNGGEGTGEPFPDCLGWSDVGEGCLFSDQCGGLAAECLEDVNCQNALSCIVQDCKVCCANDLNCLLNVCANAGGICGGASPILQGLLMCIATSCS